MKLFEYIFSILAIIGIGVFMTVAITVGIVVYTFILMLGAWSKWVKD